MGEPSTRQPGRAHARVRLHTRVLVHRYRRVWLWSAHVERHPCVHGRRRVPWCTHKDLHIRAVVHMHPCCARRVHTRRLAHVGV